MPTATDLATIVRCAHRVYLDRFADPAEKVPISDFLQLLWEEGRHHEDAVVAGLHPAAVSRALIPADRQGETVRLMKEGTPLIYHGYLEHGDLRGEPDLLQRVEKASDLGAHSYVPIDIKSASAHDKAARPKQHYLMQLCAYAELLEAHQGVRPDEGGIIDRDGAMQMLDLAAAWATYRQLRSQIDLILQGTEATEPGWKGDCSHCVWQERCWQALMTADDVTTVAGVGETWRAKLRTVGVSTASNLAGAAPAILTTVKGIGASRADAWTRQAQVQRAGTPLLLASWTPPACEFEVAYDIEDFTPDPFVYLHGLLTRGIDCRRFGRTGFTESDWGSFEPICASMPEPEASVWQRFLDAVRALEDRGDYAVYVYSPHERTTLRRLAAKYGESAALDSFVARFVDFLQVVKDSVVFPTDGRGLKALARFVGFQWRDADPGGAQSMAWWAAYVDDPVANRGLRDRIITYNEDDLRATFALRDWLESFAAPS